MWTSYGCSLAASPAHTHLAANTGRVWDAVTEVHHCTAILCVFTLATGTRRCLFMSPVELLLQWQSEYEHMIVRMRLTCSAHAPKQPSDTEEYVSGCARDHLHPFASCMCKGLVHTAGKRMKMIRKCSPSSNDCNICLAPSEWCPTVAEQNFRLALLYRYSQYRQQTASRDQQDVH